MKAIYVSVWDDEVIVRSRCKYDEYTGTIHNIQKIDSGHKVCIDEYVLLEDGTILQQGEFDIE
jgi:hypothetical protein